MVYVNSYKEIKDLSNRNKAREFARATALDCLSTLELFRPKPSVARVQFIYLHHVFADEEQALRNLLEYLLRTNEIISYSEAVEKVSSNNIDRRYICISTDDGFRNNLQAAKILNEFGTKACFFVCPSIIGESNFHVVADFCKQKLHLPPIEPLSWQDIEFLQKSGHEIGSHTSTHVNLAKVNTLNAKDEIWQSKALIERNTGPIKHFAYPYGRYFHFNRDCFDEVFKAGYVSCASAERGCHVNGKRTDAPMLIRRDQVILQWKLSHINYFLNRNSREMRLQAFLPPF